MFIEIAAMANYTFDRLPGSRYESQLRRVLQIIEAAASSDWCSSDSGAFEKAVSVPVICQADGVYMTPTNLKVHFKRTIGTTIGNYAKERRASYMGRLFTNCPDMMVKDIADRVGLANAPALYPFVKSFGIDNPKVLRQESHIHSSIKEFKTVSLPAFQVLTISHYGSYSDFNDSRFEDEWDILAQIASESGYEVKSYVGIAIDDYIRTDSNTGMFTAGVEVSNSDRIIRPLLDKRFILQTIPALEYMVFTHVGRYEHLVDFYSDAMASIRKSTKYKFNPDGVLFEKYLNSQKEVSSDSELVTELWFPILHKSSV